MSNLPPAAECCQFLYSAKAKGVSNRSYDNKWDLCAAAWIIEFGPTLFLKGGGVVPGPAGCSNTYRGELGGLLGQLLVIHTLEQCCPPQESYEIRIACDGESALYRSLTATRGDFISSHHSFDLISQIMLLKENIQGLIIPTHVKGHQDGEGLKLTELEILNVRMDKMAKEILQTAITAKEDVLDALPIVKSGIIHVDYQSTPICNSLAQTLWFLISEDRAVDWRRHKGRFQEDVSYEDVDWKVLKKTNTELLFAMRRFVAKWTSHHIGVGRMMELRQARQNNECPRCGHAEETTLHVLRCRSKGATLEKNGKREYDS